MTELSRRAATVRPFSCAGTTGHGVHRATTLQTAGPSPPATAKGWSDCLRAVPTTFRVPLAAPMCVVMTGSERPVRTPLGSKTPHGPRPLPVSGSWLKVTLPPCAGRTARFWPVLRGFPTRRPARSGPSAPRSDPVPEGPGSNSQRRGHTTYSCSPPNASGDSRSSARSHANGIGLLLT